jgi:hypothetical protein
MHGNNKKVRNAPTVDARYLHVECPEHPGITLPVTTVKVSEHHATGRQAVMVLEVLCRYCETYHYVRVNAGSVAGLAPLEWNS